MLIGILVITQLICSVVIFGLFYRARKNAKDAIPVTDYLSDILNALLAVEKALYEINNSIDRKE